MPPKETESSQRLLSLLSGERLVQCYGVAAKLGLPDVLEQGPQTAGTLAKDRDVNPDALYRLMRHLASEGMFYEEEGTFSLTSHGDRFRTGNHLHTEAMAIIASEAWEETGHLLEHIVH